MQVSGTQSNPVQNERREACRHESIEEAIIIISNIY